jgi:hypothetical protein
VTAGTLDDSDKADVVKSDRKQMEAISRNEVAKVVSGHEFSSRLAQPHRPYEIKDMNACFDCETFINTIFRGPPSPTTFISLDCKLSSVRSPSARQAPLPSQTSGPSKVKILPRTRTNLLDKSIAYEALLL